MRELVRDKGRLEDIVEYSSNVLKIIDGISLSLSIERKDSLGALTHIAAAFGEKLKDS